MIHNGILIAMDCQHVILLVLLDLSAAFDTVEHSVLSSCLSNSFGIRDTVLRWFGSYLSDRSQRVSLDGKVSDKFQLTHGVPQGSFLGPLLFTLYLSKLFDIVKGHLPHVHTYADDTQLYLAFKPDSAVNALELCICGLRTWMLHDKLKLNDDKTEFILIGTRQQLAKVDGISLCVGDSNVSPVKSAKNLGTWIDSNLNLKINVNDMCKAVYYHLKNVQHIRKYLEEKSSQTLIHALVIGRAHYCNSILFGLPARKLTKLQRLQNSVARIIFNIPKICHITPVPCSV